MNRMINKIDNSKLNDCLNIIKIAYKDRNKRLGFDKNEGHANMTFEEINEMYHNNIQMYAYFLESRIVGFISFRIEESYIKIKDLIVLPEFQKNIEIRFNLWK